MNGRRLEGTTDNLSLSGAMVSTSPDERMDTGTRVRLTLSPPNANAVATEATVRWASGVIPGMVGLEFDTPLPPDFAAVVAQAGDQALC